MRVRAASSSHGVREKGLTQINEFGACAYSSLMRRRMPIEYLSAVATAMLRCNERITRSDDTDLQVTFRQALGAAWITTPIRDLFKETLRHIS